MKIGLLFMASRIAWALGLRGKIYGKLHCMWLDAHCKYPIRKR